MYKVAMKTDISEARLSRLTTRLFEAKEGEEVSLSETLNVPSEELFPKNVKHINLNFNFMEV
tara:strand:- start:765 stop:950 length:186 start_codon:yes stop_codon:yes gene_type:complete